MNAEPRFRVLVCNGFLDAEPSGPKKTKYQPHLSASVYDSAWDRVIKTYRSEDYGTKLGTEVRRARAFADAAAHAQRLEAECEAEAA